MTERYLVTRYLTENANMFRELPDEALESISEVHFADQIGMQGTFGVDLEPDFAEHVSKADNLLPVNGLMKLSDYGLGEWVEHTTSDEIPPIEETDLMASVPTRGRVQIEQAIEASVGPYTARSYRAGPITDQGREGACTGFAGLNFINGGPMMKQPFLPNQTGFDWYEMNKDNDEWPGDDYSGSSVSAMCKNLISMGRIKDAAYTTSFDTMVKWKQDGRGGLMISTPWYEGQYRTDANGFCRPTGRKVGGHAIWDRGVTSWLTAIWRNSWGPDWGFSGNGYVSSADMKFLIANGLKAYMARQIT